jgi:hypothetical protein
MGMDIEGIKPKNVKGQYFVANLWAWRPINFICSYVNEKEQLGFNMEYWDSNSGYGLNNGNDCNILADAIERLLAIVPDLNEDDDKLYVNMGFWVDSSNIFITDKDELNKEYPIGTIMFTSIIDKNGRKVEPAHSISLGRLKDFIEFLRNSGGFKIY